MGKNLLVVESPAKAKTIQKYLGRQFRIMASVGHLKDLPENRLGVEIEDNFRPEYVTIKGKGKILTALKKAAKGSEKIYLGPDPDREGEAIAWHIAQELGNGDREIYRVLFNELTPKAIREAVSSPQGLNLNKFESQQARRILDRLVGYQISPLLWTRVRRGLSAGRVQSVALRMICDREREIQAFEPREYWSLTAHLRAELPPDFKARLLRYDGEKIDLDNKDKTLRIASEAEKHQFRVEKVTRKKKKRNPPPPFTTSLLQQEAYKRLGFSAKRTMSIAQGLYEGVELGESGQVGLITYMRTDSFRLSEDAVSEVRGFISKRFGKDFVPHSPNRFRSRKGAQEAHEAIRPTSSARTPQSVASYLSKDQLSLYSLIWTRFVACQMSSAVLEQTEVEIQAGRCTFKAAGSVVVFEGFLTLYGETATASDANGGQEFRLPPLKKGQRLELLNLEPAQHFTQPPPRYSEATLIKALEENGIGRPSTYASILANISGREYVTLEKGRFRPTELGFLVTDLLVQNFPEILDTTFTAQMENKLDKIERGGVKWTKVLKDFYGSFQRDLERAQREMKGEIPTQIECLKCGRPMVIKSGKNGLFLACTGYPECRYTTNFSRDEKGQIVVQGPPEPDQHLGACEKCGRPMVTRMGRFGPFLACSGYPECKNTRPLTPEARPGSTSVSCPNKGCDGKLVERTSKRGRRFYACNRYPKCRFVIWDEPYDGTCPQCGTPVLGIRRPRNSKAYLVCRKKGCSFKRPLEDLGDGELESGPGESVQGS